MRASDIIAKKRDGQILASDEIEWLISSYMQDKVPDYQMSAWLMAVYLRGMTIDETTALTMTMVRSGSVVDLTGIPGIKVDKHSTGGVADTTTLVLAPLVAAAGIPVAKMSGRGLGFTGGTIDKLESISGFKVSLTENEFTRNLLQHGIVVAGQSSDLAPADGRLYALRDVTATIESIPLIASSIMSKKIAAGADKILLDVKVGSGAFMKDLHTAVKLAQTMVDIGKKAGRETIAVLTDMSQPLGQAVGNSLEVCEAVEILKGHHSPLRDVCLHLGAHMVVLGGKAPTLPVARTLLASLLDNGVALKKLIELIDAQGGNAAFIYDPNLLPRAKYSATLFSSQEGFIENVDAAQIGQTAMFLGAGREKKGDAVDVSAGLIMHVRVSDYVHRNQPLAELYTNSETKLPLASDMVQQSVRIGKTKTTALPLIIGTVSETGFIPEKTGISLKF